MSVSGTIRTAVFLLGLLLVVTIGGAFLNALLVRVEPMLLYGMPNMLSGYMEFRTTFITIWSWGVRFLVIVAEYILVTSAIEWVGNVYQVIRGAPEG